MKCRVLKKRGEVKFYIHAENTYCLKCDKMGMSYIFPDSVWTLHLGPKETHMFSLSGWSVTDYDSVKKQCQNA